MKLANVFLFTLLAVATVAASALKLTPLPTLETAGATTGPTVPTKLAEAVAAGIDTDGVEAARRAVFPERVKSQRVAAWFVQPKRKKKRLRRSILRTKRRHRW